MSKTVHPVGQILLGNKQPKVAQEIEDALESYLPSDCLSRLDAVYTVEIPDFSMLGIEAGYIYLVEIEDLDLHSHDSYWVGQLQLARIKLKNSFITSYLPDWTADFVSSCCNRYWTGIASQKPKWEFLSRQAVVKKQLSSCVVDPAVTTGWKSPDEIVCKSRLT